MDLIIQDLCKAYYGQAVLQDFSYCFPEGKTTCIMGRSGCGKTTLLNLILGFSVSNIIMLIVGVVALVLMLNRVPYINYIVAVFLAIMFLTHIGANLSNLGSQWIYLLEGLLDLGAAAVLVFEKNVRAFFGK